MHDPSRFARWLALGVLCLAGPLYAAGWWNAPPGMRFTGSIIDWPGDASYHLTWPRQAADGAILFEDKFNGERVDSRLVFNWYFLVLGWGARILGTEPVFVWYAAQALLVLLAVRLCVALGTRFFSEPRWRTAFVVAALFGGGFGWLRPLLPGWRVGRLIDLEMVETIPFAWMLSDVIVPPAVVTMLAVMLRYVDHVLGRRPGLPALPLLFVVLAYVHPHDCLPLFVTLSLCELWRVGRGSIPLREAARLPLAVAAVLALPALHYLLILDRDPHLWSYVGLQDGYGIADLLLAFPWHLAAATGLALARDPQSGDAPFVIPGLWFGAAAALLLTPMLLGNQHYLVHGMPFALSLLGAEGARRWWRAGLPERLPPVPRRVAGGVLALALFATSGLVYARDVHRALTRYAAWYLPLEYHEAFDWLRAHARRDSTALASPDLGHQLTRFVGLRVRTAAPEQTVDYDEALARQRAWLAGEPEAADWPRRSRASWVVLSREEAGSLAPRVRDSLEPAFANARVEIFRVPR